MNSIRHPHLHHSSLRFHHFNPWISSDSSSFRRLPVTGLRRARQPRQLPFTNDKSIAGSRVICHRQRSFHYAAFDITDLADVVAASRSGASPVNHPPYSA
jgi:hypothetical protein